MIATTDSKEIAQKAQLLAAAVHSAYPAITLSIVIHRRGMRQEAVYKTLTSLNGHPAYDSARDLLTRPGAKDTSSVIGIVLSHERGLFGMKGKPAGLAFISLNTDQYQTSEEAQYALYHLVGQFFDLMGFITAETLRGKGDTVLQPRRSSLSLARANMKADIFSALMMTTDGQKDAIRDLAQLRAMQSLIGQPYQRPEEYPYAISVDVATFAAEKLQPLALPALLQSVHQLSASVSRTFDKQNFETWINFTSPAQTMAWAGCAPDQILGAAIHTCANPFIKSVGNLISEITSISPLPKEELQTGYNPYVENEINQISHDRQVEETFDMVMIHSMEADSALPLIHVANNQNDAMGKGKVLGWCAHALQSAAKAYNTALQRGVPPEQAARLEFQSAKNQTSWNTLNQISDQVLNQRRQGMAVTLSEIAGWCKNTVDFRPVMESLNMTLADPGYSRKLAATMDLPGPAGPSLGMAPAPAPSIGFSPQMAFAPAAPGLGGGSRGGLYIPPQTTQTSTETKEE